MSYDVTEDVAQIREHLRAALAERDANWAALDALRTRLRRLVPDVAEGGDLVGAVERLLAASRSRAATEEGLRESEEKWRRRAIAIAEALEDITECDEHRPCGACREKICGALASSPGAAPTERRLAGGDG